jgi:hypothetical protein
MMAIGRHQLVQEQQQIAIDPRNKQNRNRQLP